MRLNNVDYDTKIKSVAAELCIAHSFSSTASHFPSFTFELYYYLKNMLQYISFPWMECIWRKGIFQYEESHIVLNNLKNQNHPYLRTCPIRTTNLSPFLTDILPSIVSDKKRAFFFHFHCSTLFCKRSSISRSRSFKIKLICLSL